MKELSMGEQRYTAVMAVLSGGRLTNGVQKSTVSERHPGGDCGEAGNPTGRRRGLGPSGEGEVGTNHALLGRTAEHSERSLGGEERHDEETSEFHTGDVADSG